MVFNNPDEQYNKGINILVIDDNASMCDAIRMMLQSGGYNVMTALNGPAGIEMAQQNPPDLVLCDIMMPNMDGYAVFQEFRKELVTATIPFIFLTALASREDLHKGMGLGADDYLTKPIGLQELLSRVNARLARSRQLRLERLQGFAQRLVDLQEYERQRVAEVLQNQVRQRLMGLKLTLALGESAPASSQATVYKDATDLLGDLIQQVDDFSYSLYPPMLSQLGLLPTLTWLIEHYSLDIQLQTVEMDYDFDPETKTAVFRLIQQALDNIAQHAKAQHVKIELVNNQTTLDLLIEDDGSDFDIETAMYSGSSGLMAIYERVTTRNGEINVTSIKEHGTTIKIKLPVKTAYPASTAGIPRTDLGKLFRQLPRKEAVDADKSIRVLIASEHTALCEGLRRLLTRYTNFHYVSEVTQLDQLPAAVVQHRPDLLVINPLADGKIRYEIIQEVVKENQDVNVLVISPSRKKSYVLGAFQSGARGFVPEDTTTNDLYTAISNVGRGQIYLSPTIVDSDILIELGLLH